MPLRPLPRNRDLPPSMRDVRGWKVRTALDDERVGRVDDMLVDEHDELRFLDVDLGRKRRVLVPLRHTRIDGDADTVWVEGVAREQLEAMPTWDGDPDHAGPTYVRDVEAGFQAAREPRRERGGGERLARLGDLDDYRIAKGDTDPRGWHIVTADGAKVGKVSELIVDTADMEARYLDCDVDEKKLGLEPIDRHVLVPVEHVRLDRDRKEAVVDALPSHALGEYPVYAGLPLTDDARRGMDRLLGGTRRRDDTPRDFDTPRGRRPDDDRIADAVDRIDDDDDARTTSTLRTDSQEVRIRLAGDDVIIEKRPLPPEEER